MIDQEIVMPVRWPLPMLFMVAMGCGKSPPAPDAPITVSVPTPNKAEPVIDTTIIKSTATEIVGKIRNGTLPISDVSIEFRKVIGEPLTPDERVLGFSDSAAAEWLKRVGSRLANDTVTLIQATDITAIFELDVGTLRLVKKSGRWQVDWFHAGRSKAAAPLTGGDGFKRFALASLLDPIATGEWALAETALSEAAKAQLAPPLGRDVGFNRGTLQTKLKSLRNGTGGYSVTWNEKTATVMLNGSEGRALTVTVGDASNPSQILIQSLTLPE